MKYLRPFLSIKFLICFMLAWMITNGWSYIFITIGSLKDIKWMLKVALSYQAFLWLPITPEKLVTIPIAMWFNFKFFKDAKTEKMFKELKVQALKDFVCVYMCAYIRIIFPCKTFLLHFYYIFVAILLHPWYNIREVRKRCVKS